jgi:hypothetical protein
MVHGSVVKLRGPNDAVDAPSCRRAARAAIAFKSPRPITYAGRTELSRRIGMGAPSRAASLPVGSLASEYELHQPSQYCQVTTPHSPLFDIDLRLARFFIPNRPVHARRQPTPRQLQRAPPLLR